MLFVSMGTRGRKLKRNFTTSFCVLSARTMQIPVHMCWCVIFLVGQESLGILWMNSFMFFHHTKCIIYPILAAQLLAQQNTSTHMFHWRKYSLITPSTPLVWLLHPFNDQETGSYWFSDILQNSICGCVNRISTFIFTFFFYPAYSFSLLLTKMSRSHYPHLKYCICRKLSRLPW